MALSIAKAKQAGQKKTVGPKTDVSQVHARKLVDLLGDTTTKLKAHEAKIEQLTEYKKLLELQGKVKDITDEIHKLVEPGLAGNEDALVRGSKFKYALGQQKTRREVTDRTALMQEFEEAEEGLAAKLASFKLGDIDKHITKAKQAKIGIVEHQDGKRSGKLSEIEA